MSRYEILYCECCNRSVSSLHDNLCEDCKKEIYKQRLEKAVKKYLENNYVAI